MDLDGPEHDEHDAPPDAPVTVASDVPAASDEPDLERIAGDLADIDRALERLDDGSYWTDEVTGEPLPDEQLAQDPTARRTTYTPASTDDPPAPA